MAVVELTKEQIYDLVRQMPSQEKRALLFVLAENGSTRAQRQQLAEEHLRRLCAGRGLDWDAMNAEQREAFFDDLVHEDRPCAP